VSEVRSPDIRRLLRDTHNVKVHLFFYLPLEARLYVLAKIKSTTGQLPLPTQLRRLLKEKCFPVTYTQALHGNTVKAVWKIFRSHSMTILALRPTEKQKQPAEAKLSELLLRAVALRRPLGQRLAHLTCPHVEDKRHGAKRSEE